MNKIFLFDVDGVLIRPPHFYSTELENNGFKGAVNSLDKFHYGEEFKKVLEGKEDPLNILPKYLNEFGWNKSTVEFLNEQFEYEASFLDTELMTKIQEIRKSGTKCLLATDQAIHRAKYLLQNMRFSTLFDGVFISCDIGFRKSQEGFWINTIKYLQSQFSGLDPKSIYFFDDNQTNLDCASKFGLNTILYRNISDLISILS